MDNFLRTRYTTQMGRSSSLSIPYASQLPPIVQLRL
jgi:hypothetical protein